MSVDGTRHIWAANDLFGKYFNKQYFLPRQPFVCCLNVTIQRHPDTPTRGIFKRSEFIYQVEADGYRCEYSFFHLRHLACQPSETFDFTFRSWVPLSATSSLSKYEIFNQTEPHNWKWSHFAAWMQERFPPAKYRLSWNSVRKWNMERKIPNLWK